MESMESVSTARAKGSMKAEIQRPTRGGVAPWRPEAKSEKVVV